MGSLSLLSFHSLCLHLRSYLTSIPEYFFVILSQRKACAGRFQKETAGKKTGPITKWPPRRLLFTWLEIVFVAISPFTKPAKVVPKVFQEGQCCLEGLINLACGLQLQMLPRLNGHFMNALVWFCMYHHRISMVTRRLLLELLASVLSPHVRFQILGSSYQFY